MTTEHQTTVQVYSVDFVVDYYWHPFYAGKRGDYGMQMEPDEPAHAEIQMVYIEVAQDDERVEIMDCLSQDCLDRIEEQLEAYNG